MAGRAEEGERAGRGEVGGARGRVREQPGALAPVGAAPARALEAVVGWATVNRSTLDWPEGGVPLYINPIGNENVAQCPDARLTAASGHSVAAFGC